MQKDIAFRYLRQLAIWIPDHAWNFCHHPYPHAITLHIWELINQPKRTGLVACRRRCLRFPRRGTLPCCCWAIDGPRRQLHTLIHIPGGTPQRRLAASGPRPWPAGEGRECQPCLKRKRRALCGWRIVGLSRPDAASFRGGTS
jgi:hypothetical protein